MLLLDVNDKIYGMRKWVVIATISLVIATGLTGCGNAIPELTEEQQSQVCEYAAQALVRHMRGYQSMVLDEQQIANESQRLEDAAALRAEIEAEKEASKKAKEEAKNDANEGNGTDSSSNVAVYHDLGEFVGLDGVKLSYAGYEVCDSYPSDTEAGDWQGVCRATNGNKLVVFKYDMTNVTSGDCTVDIASKNIRCTFKVGGSVNKTALTTMLSNDLLMYRGVVAVGDTNQAVAVIEMSEEDASNLSSVKMKVKCGGESMETTLF